MEHLGATISDRRLTATLDAVVANATAFWQIGLTRHPDFTLHGIVHSSKISEMLQGISENIPADCSLNDNEKFILVSSAYLHDIGMVFPLKTFIANKAYNNPVLKGRTNVECCELVIKDLCRQYDCEPYAEEFFRDLEQKPLPGSMREGETIRFFHHLFSDSMIHQHGKSFGIPRHAIPLVAAVSRGHRIVDLSSDKYQDTAWLARTVRIGPLAALLRIADELDYSAERAPDIIFEIMLDELIADPISLVHWIRHLCIRSVGPIEFSTTPQKYVEPIVKIVAAIPRDDYRIIIDEQLQKSFSQTNSEDVRECLQRIGLCCPRIELQIDAATSSTCLPSPLLQRVGSLKIDQFLRQQQENMVIEQEQDLIRDGFDGQNVAKMVGYRRNLYKVAYDCLDMDESRITWEIELQAAQELSHITHFFEQTDEPFCLVSDLDLDNLTPSRTIRTERRLTRGDTCREIDISIDPPLQSGERASFRFSEVYRGLFLHNTNSIVEKIHAGLWPFDDAVEALGSNIRVPTEVLEISITLPEGIEPRNADFRTRLTHTKIPHEPEDKRLRKLGCLRTDFSGQRKEISLLVPDPQLMVTYWLVWVPEINITGSKLMPPVDPR